MKNILFLAFTLFTFGNIVLGQSVQLKNLLLTQHPDSKIVYAGIQNLFKLTSAAKVEKVECSEASVQLISDTLKLVPRLKGKMNVTIRTSDGMQLVTFEAHLLPPLTVAITSDSGNTVQRDDILAFAKVVLSGGKKDTGGFAAHYKISTWQATLNGATFFASGETFPDVLLKALRDCNAGSAFSIGQIEAYNPDNNERLQIQQKIFYTCTIL